MKKINQKKQLKETRKYIYSKNKVLVWLFIIGLVISILLTLFAKEAFFDRWLDPVVGIMTFMVAAAIALLNYKKSWQESLPKTLTVHYKYHNKYYLSCHYADLTSEADIRTWAQQIGSQMTDGAFLDFNPFFDLSAAKVIELEPNKTPALHHEINILLKGTTDARSKKELFNGLYKQWYIVHNSEHYPDEKIVLPLIDAPQELPIISYADLLNNKHHEHQL